MAPATKKRGPKARAVSKPAPADTPSVAKAAAKVVEQHEGEGPLSSTERVRAYRARKKEADTPVDIEVNESDIAAAAQVGGVLWSIVGPMAGCRELDADQERRLGVALAPLIKKYLPLLADWQYEAAAVFCIMALARETHVPPKSGEADEEGAVTRGNGLDQDIRS